VGVHGLPLMGSGDWNDGMNRVGTKGRGESVWLGWFLCRLVADFAPLARQRAATPNARNAGTTRPPAGGRAERPGLGRRSGSSAPSSTTARRWARRPTPRRAST
jgi:hypothetical protein